ncbi:hypothetical protein K402DRAFT_94368 [Aulographum hederae CBS 113979]|uniref:Uncharacterized protein n=1 Tax=Aulographum hederae CBS 113979 TaxID=1176131 RepID=A0A6G1GY85_9PEZI|nr:hypothetical protein K402DRAFT_94368 [Aulographum hederae CBS 113979]
MSLQSQNSLGCLKIIDFLVVKRLLLSPRCSRRASNVGSEHSWTGQTQRIPQLSIILEQVLSLKQCCRRGALKHRSYSDPGDPKDVVSLTLLTQGETPVISTHVHEDGTHKSK